MSSIKSQSRGLVSSWYEHKIIDPSNLEKGKLKKKTALAFSRALN